MSYFKNDLKKYENINYRGLGYLASVLIPKLLDKKIKIICVEKFK